MIATLLLIISPVAALKAGLSVCTNKACKKAGSLDSLALLRDLATTAKTPHARAPASVTAASLQQAYACSLVDSCGCLGGCGSGPNVASYRSGEVFHDVYKPLSGQALLEAELGLDVPDAAVKAYLKKMYADRALRSNKPRDAIGLLTAALNEAGTLRTQAAFLLSRLLEQRADVHESLGDSGAAESDRAAAARMLALPAQELEVA